MTRALCGHPTSNGPCNMRKGHNAPYHRNSDRRKPMEWRIKYDDKILEFGEGRVEFGYALTKYLEQHDTLVIEVAK